MSEFLRLAEQYQSALEQLTSGLRDTVSYRNDPDLGLVPSSFDPEKRVWGTVADAYHQTELNPPNFINIVGLGAGGEDACLQRMQEYLELNTPYKDFSFLAQGSGTMVLLGRSEHRVGVLRVVAHPDSPVPFKNMDDSVRSHFPGLLQGQVAPLDIEDKLRTEELKFVHSQEIPLADHKILDTLLTELTKGTCYKPHISEFAILPDLTLMGLDPGECPYNPEFWDLSPEQQVAEEKRSVDIIMERLSESYPHLASLGWFMPDGQLKQNVLFPVDDNGNAPSYNLDK